LLITENKGQKTEAWSDFWDGLTPESEIRMGDYYGLRPWILKYTPRSGKVCEAGCGLGRYNFYLSRLGIDIVGLDFEKKTIDYLNKWKLKNGFEETSFIEGDVTNLPFKNNSLSGYISLGVVEHFVEGPQKPIKEAFRILRPGGISIITTPAPSWSKFYFKLKSNVKNVIKKLLFKKISAKQFFQYEYNLWQLKKHVQKQGFYISRYAGADLLYTFTELGHNTDRYIKQESSGYKISHLLENSWLSFLGAQSIVIAIKADDLMHCFFCGMKTAKLDSLKKYDVPACDHCETSSNITFYKKGNKVSFHEKYLITPPLKPIEKKVCDLCKIDYLTDSIFEDFGFDKNICPACLGKKNINIQLSNTSIQPIWRSRLLK